MKKNQRQSKRFLLPAVLAVIAANAVSLPVQASEITSGNIVRLVNEAREKEGVAILETSAVLGEIAREKAEDMLENDYFAHTSPKGITPWYWFGKNGYDYRYAGENLAINFQDAESEQSAWMGSPTHRKNILNADYREVGVAVVSGKIDGKPAIIAVQEFGTRAGGSKPADKKESTGADKAIETDGKEIAPAILSVKDENASGGSTGGGQSVALAELFRSMAIYLMLALSIAVPAAVIWEYREAIMGRIRGIGTRRREAARHSRC